MNLDANIIKHAEQFVKEELASDRSGHDWWHIDRVRNIAVKIAQNEKANRFVCELSALLHDVADEKLNVSKEAGLDKVQDWLFSNLNDDQIAKQVITIISTMSFNGGKNPPMETIEGQIVQDADRLDAIGAIGIARTFTYAGWKGHLIHNPEMDFSNNEYRTKDNTAINHFYEKLLKLKDLMNTQYGREMAEKRHKYMEDFLKQFYNEWEIE
jgi:uncharacterized protein